MAARPSSASPAARIGFVAVALEVALTFCRLAHEANDTRHLSIYLSKARKAYDIAMRYMFGLDMSAKEFHAITANAERVKLMLESLQSRTVPASAPPTEPISSAR
jgi:hypothetical protein